MSARYPVIATPTAHGLVPPTDSPADSGKVLSQTGWVSTGGGSPHALGSHTDTVITSVADGHVLTYDSGTGKWVNEAPAGGGAFGISDATDVTITTVADEDFLVYDTGTGQWRNRKIIAADIPTLSSTNVSEGSNLYYTDERVDDRVAALIVNGTGLSWSYNDAGGTLTGNVQDNTTTQKVRVSKAGTLIGTRREVNLIEGSNVTLTVADDSGNDRVNVTVASSAGGGSSPTRLRMTSDLTTSSTTLGAITGLSTFTLSANTVYRFRAVLFVTTNAGTVGIHFGVNFTGTVTHVRVGHEANPAAAVSAAGSAVSNAAATAVNTKIIATSAGPGTSPAMVVLEGIIEVGASGGTFSFQFASETASVTTVQRGSYAEVESIA